LISFEVEDTLTCAETADEPPTTRRERVNKLVCNIQGGGTNSSGGVNHLHEGLALSLEGTVEKRSEILGRDALWKKQQKISQLPRYLCVQFMRFFWKPTPESMDHAGVKCKIMRPVTYPEVLLPPFPSFSCLSNLSERYWMSTSTAPPLSNNPSESIAKKRTRRPKNISISASRPTLLTLPLLLPQPRRVAQWKSSDLRPLPLAPPPLLLRSL
jgi:hypothetical protein